jgi:hypothetical protein
VARRRYRRAIFDFLFTGDFTGVRAGTASLVFTFLHQDCIVHLSSSSPSAQPLADRVPAAAPSQRLHAFDALRALALILGIVAHASMSYIPNSKYFWLAHDSDPQATFGLFFFVPHMFRMLLFFTIAGFFARLSLQRRGALGFARDRALRIGAPLLIGWPLTMMALTLILVWSAWLEFDGKLPKNPLPGPAFTPDDFPLTHLWFLYVLCLCYCAVLALRGLLGVADRTGRLRAVLLRMAKPMTGAFGPFLLAIPLSIALVSLPKWYAWFGIPTPDQSLYPNIAACVGYGSAFAFGWLLHAREDTLGTWSRRWPLHLAFAIFATAGCMWMRGIAPFLKPESGGADTWLYAALYATGAWCWVFALCGFAARAFRTSSPVWRYLADASYWVYLAHLPLVLALQVVASRFDWADTLGFALSATEFVLIVSTSIVLLLVSYHIFVRHTWIGRLLNGDRKRQPRDAAPNQAVEFV